MISNLLEYFFTFLQELLFYSLFLHHHHTHFGTCMFVCEYMYVLAAEQW